MIQTQEINSSPSTYNLRVRRNVVIDRDYSPPAPARKKQRLQKDVESPKEAGRAKEKPTPKKVSVAAARFAVPLVEDFYFNALKCGKSPTALIEKWMKEYDNSPDQAIVQFLQLIVAACGCSGKLDANMVHNMEMKDIITQLGEYFEKDSGEYPLVITSSQMKKFRTSFGDFLTLFIIRGKTYIIMDVTLMDSLIQMLTGLSESSIRSFRHTATFAAMKIASGIVDVVVEMVESREKNTTQIETEKAKVAQMGESERLEVLLQQKADLDSKIDELSAMIQYVFRSVFVHRYRDVVTDIRAICITELGNWIRIYPQLFLDDSYLKYIGWCLCDKQSEVRLRSVTALLPLYEKYQLVRCLELFTNKFKDRIASMVMDVETEVATKACQLLTHIYRAFPALLTTDDCVPIYEMVYCNNRQVAIAAAEFVNAKLFTPNSEDMMEDGTSSSSTIGNNHQLIKNLVSFYKEKKVHNHPSYLVDSFIDIAPMLKDWPTMISILLSNEFYADDTDLVAIMSAAVKQAATGEHPPNRIVISIRRGPGAGTEKKDLRMLQEERMRISEVFIPTLPRLLAKFIADQEKISNLLEIFMHFELELYSAGRHEQPLNELMQMIDRIAEQYSNEDLIKQLACIFQFIATDLAVAQFTETSRIRLIDAIAGQLRMQLQQVHQEKISNQGETNDETVRQTKLDQEDEAALLSSYRKMMAFTAALDIPSRWDLWNESIEMLESCHIQSDDLMDKAVILCFQNLTWSLKRLMSGPDWKEEDVEILKRKRDQFIRMAKGIVRDMASGVENAFKCLSDTLILFNWKLASNYPLDHPFHNLAVKLDRETSNSICAFVMDNIFVENAQGNDLDEHAKIQLLAKRRNILAHYTKLFIYGVVPIIDIAGILRYFTKFYADFGDIFKNLLQECKKLDKATTAKAIVKALMHKFEELKILADQTIVDQDSEEFQALRELAKRFALSFGVDNIKHREALAMIHHDGINYSLQLGANRRDQQQKLENLPFLEILQEFSPKLHRQDKLAVLRYLDKHCPEEKEGKEMENEDIWQTFHLYRNSLAKAEAAAAATNP